MRHLPSRISVGGTLRAPQAWQGSLPRGGAPHRLTPFDTALDLLKEPDFSRLIPPLGNPTRPDWGLGTHSSKGSVRMTSNEFLVLLRAVLYIIWNVAATIAAYI